MRLFGQWGAEFPRNWRPETGINSAVSQCWITHWSGIILVNNLLSLVFLPPVSLPVSMLVGLSTWRQTLYWSGKPPTLFLPFYISVVIKSWYRQSLYSRYQWIQWLPALRLYHHSDESSLWLLWWQSLHADRHDIHVNIMAARITTFSLQ